MTMASTLLKAASTALLLSHAGRVRAQAAATSGDLSVLTFNVAGLPGIIQDNNGTGDKTTNTKLMGTYFTQYDFDVINVQEDFNYHAALYEADKHPYRTATSGGVPFGSGLNTLSNYPFLGFTRTKWNKCSNFDSSDCLTPKGFTFMRVQVSPLTDNNTASYIDMYNMHSDAGVTDADLVARQDNLNQVLAYVDVWSPGNAVLIYGDTNSRYSRVNDTAIRAYLDAGFSDAWVEKALAGAVPTAESLCTNPQPFGNTTCETVDKVFYRSSPLLALEATSFDYVSDWFLDASGNTLSDHNPVNVNLTWTAGAKLQQSAFWGGSFGAWFSDVAALDKLDAAALVVKNLTLSGNERLDSVGLALADGTSLTHGGTGGTPATLALADGERWASAKVCQGVHNDKTRIFSLEATTSAGNTLSAGTATSDCATFAAPEGWAIVGFVGQDGDEVDQLAFVYAPQ